MSTETIQYPARLLQCETRKSEGFRLSFRSSLTQEDLPPQASSPTLHKESQPTDDSIRFHQELSKQWEELYATDGLDGHSREHHATPFEDAPRQNSDVPGKEKEEGERHISTAFGFYASICLSQLMTEYLITGFALELPRLLNPTSDSMGTFWAACLLTIILSALLLISARVSDKYGGFYPFCTGSAWLAVWCLIPAFLTDQIWLSVSRANQGLAIAAFTPAVLSLVSSSMLETRRQTLVLAVYASCAPLGFFFGFLMASILPTGKISWYFLVPALLMPVAAVLAFYTAPRKSTAAVYDYEMDWSGSLAIMAGLVLTTCGVSIASSTDQQRESGNWSPSPTALALQVSGVACLLVSIWLEGWVAVSPLLPWQFFRAREVQILCSAGIFLYASFGVWLYDSALLLQSPIATGLDNGYKGVTLALLYAPTGLGGLIICLLGGTLLKKVPAAVLLLVSGLAWVTAPLLLASGPTPLDYWRYVLPSMLCATIGIDLTYTISLICIARAQPMHYQALSGATCGMLLNLAVSFALPISEIIAAKVDYGQPRPIDDLVTAHSDLTPEKTLAGYRAAFLYAIASAAVGFLLIVLYICTVPSFRCRRRGIVDAANVHQ